MAAFGVDGQQAAQEVGSMSLEKESISVLGIDQKFDTGYVVERIGSSSPAS